MICHVDQKCQVIMPFIIKFCKTLSSCSRPYIGNSFIFLKNSKVLVFKAHNCIKVYKIVKIIRVMLLINVKIITFKIANSYNYFSRHISCKTQFLQFFIYIFFILWEAEGHSLRLGGPLLARGPQVGNPALEHSTSLGICFDCQ